MTWIAESDHGSHGQPGSQYHKIFAGVKEAANGQYELHVRDVRGSNQGYLEEHHRSERRFRADDLVDLMERGINAISEDEDFCDNAGKFSAAIRDAIYDTQDSLVEA